MTATGREAPAAGDTPRRDPSTLCPSARWGMDGAVVFGVAGAGAGGRVGYLDRLVPASPEVLGLVGPADPADVFRVAAPCAEAACQHFAESRCRLAGRVARLLPAVATGPPACRLRPACRWWKQEGLEACVRCPQIVSGQSSPSELLVLVADPAAPVPGG